MKSKGQNIVFYISYSGLGKEIEPAISEEILKENFRGILIERYVLEADE